jgi:hypothetical protein
LGDILRGQENKCVGRDSFTVSCNGELTQSTALDTLMTGWLLSFELADLLGIDFSHICLLIVEAS